MSDTRLVASRAPTPQILRVLALYCPDLPPEPGGVSDHTVVLARALASRGVAVNVLAQRGSAVGLIPLPVRFLSGPRELSGACVAAGATSLVVQYVPQLHGHRGVAPALAPALAKVAQAGIPVVLILHELYLPLRGPWLSLLSLLQRRQLRAILKAAHAALTPVPAWLGPVRAAAPPGVRVRLAPVGATLPVSSASKTEARAALGFRPDDVVIGLISPGAGGFLVEWVRQAMVATRAVANVRWLACGFGSESLHLEGLRATGPLPGPDLARAVRAFDIAAAPFHDGLTMRRSSAMLALASGVATVSSTGHLFDFRLTEYAACEPDAATFSARITHLAVDADARAALARKAADAGSVTSTAVLADAILDALASPRTAA